MKKTEKPDQPNYLNYKFSKSQIDKAGELIRKSKNQTHQYKKALKVIKEWRSYHSKPLTSIRNHIEYKGKEIDKNSLTIQRLKRLVSIQSKLQRSTTRLSKMQDIRGCRTIVSNKNKLYKLYQYLKEDRSNKKSVIKIQDHVNNPNKITGYRGIHIIYKYLDKYQIESQLRTKVQHSWATAVEIAGTFLGQDIKSGRVEENYNEWLDFFKFTSILFSFEENLESEFDKQFDLNTVKNDLIALENRLRVFDKLESYSLSTKVIEMNNNELNFKKNEIFVIFLDKLQELVTIYSYKKDQEIEAKEKFFNIERKLENDKNNILVFVSAKSLNDIKVGFPNYFADSKLFINTLRNILYNK